MENNSRASKVQIEYVSSTDNSPFAALEPTDSKISLSYPNDLGSQPQHRHVLRIKIYKQNKSVISQPLIEANSFDATRKAGASKNTQLSVTGGAIGAAATSGALGVAKALGQSALGYAYRRLRLSNKPLSTREKIGYGAGVVSALGESVIPGAIALGATQIDTSRKTKKKNIEEPQAYINLYMPDSLLFGDRHDFKPVSLTDAFGISGLFGQGKIGAGEYSGAAAEKSGLMNSGTIAASIFSSGYALNPQVEILYGGTTNRSFTFKFKFVPRNAQESDTIDSIIRTLRFHASPEYANFGDTKEVQDPNANDIAKRLNRAYKKVPVMDSRYFVPPSEFEVEYLAFDENGNLYRNTKLPRIAQSVLTSIQTNYAPSGRFTAFNDNSPTEIDLELTFTETIVLTKEDIKAGY